MSPAGWRPRLLVRFEDPNRQSNRKDFATDGKRFYSPSRTGRERCLRGRGHSEVSVLGCPRRGTPFSRSLSAHILGLGGWQVEGDLPDEPRFVLIVAPHTSAWDFFVCILAMFTIGLRLSWLGKHTLFRFPVAPVLRWLGGEPIDRDASRGTVEIAIERFRDRTQWVLGLSPEGTRKRAEEWKTGFLRIAVGAGVPKILPVWLDYQRRGAWIGPAFWPSGDQEADMDCAPGTVPEGNGPPSGAIAEPAESTGRASLARLAPPLRWPHHSATRHARRSRLSRCRPRRPLPP